MVSQALMGFLLTPDYRRARVVVSSKMTMLTAVF